MYNAPRSRVDDPTPPLPLIGGWKSGLLTGAALGAGGWLLWELFTRFVLFEFVEVDVRSAADMNRLALLMAASLAVSLLPCLGVPLWLAWRRLWLAATGALVAGGVSATLIGFAVIHYAPS